MSILIKGMEMPKNCALCKFRGAGETWCPFTLREVPGNTIPEDCPLVPVPPHGRLIDADELAAICDEPHWCAWLSDIDNAPTIISAEPPKDEAQAGPYDLLYEEGGYNSNGV